MKPPHDEFCSQTDRACVVANRASKEVPKQVRGVGDYVSPEENRLNEFRVRFAELLFQWGTQPGLDHKRKLNALKMASRNVRPAVKMLLHRAGDKATARSDVVLCLADMAGQLLDVVADLTQPEAAKTPANLGRARHGSNNYRARVGADSL